MKRVGTPAYYYIHSRTHPQIYDQVCEPTNKIFQKAPSKYNKSTKSSARDVNVDRAPLAARTKKYYRKFICISSYRVSHYWTERFQDGRRKERIISAWLI